MRYKFKGFMQFNFIRYWVSFNRLIYVAFQQLKISTLDQFFCRCSPFVGGPRCCSVLLGLPLPETALFALLNKVFEFRFNLPSDLFVGQFFSSIQIFFPEVVCAQVSHQFPATGPKARSWIQERQFGFHDCINFFLRDSNFISGSKSRAARKINRW